MHSPAGQFIFPKLNEPDFRFKEEFGEFTVQVQYTEAELAPFVKTLEDERQRLLPAIAKAYNKPLAKVASTLAPLPFKPATEGKGAEAVELPGLFWVKFAVTGGGFRRKKIEGEWVKEPWYTKLVAFDANNQPIPNDVMIYGGTVGRVAFACQPWWSTAYGGAGLKLALRSTKILDLVTAGGERSASQEGWGDDDEGYTYTAEGAADGDEEAGSVPAGDTGEGEEREF